MNEIHDLAAQVGERAYREARTGAPADMVAWYVTVEAQHATAGHDGDAQRCTPCNDAVSRWHDRAARASDAAALGGDGA